MKIFLFFSFWICGRFIYAVTYSPYLFYFNLSSELSWLKSWDLLLDLFPFFGMLKYRLFIIVISELFRYGSFLDTLRGWKDYFITPSFASFTYLFSPYIYSLSSIYRSLSMEDFWYRCFFELSTLIFFALSSDLTWMFKSFLLSSEFLGLLLFSRRVGSNRSEFISA